MKKHVPVILFVVLLLGGVYVFGRPEPAAKPSTSTAFNTSQFSLTDPTSKWVVVNKLRPLKPLNYAPTDLTAVGNGQQLRREAASNLEALLQAAIKAGYQLTPESGYRAYDVQAAIYKNEVIGFGAATADKESARPGYSEHQTGWAIDLGSGNCNVQDCFSDTPAGKWTIANSYRYGFLLRYPVGKTQITGYRNEAWHFRYVGKPLAIEAHRKHVATLEEFFGLPAAPDYK